MSYTKETQVTVWCDDESECNEFMSDTSTVAELRRYTHNSGWATVHGKDFCPRHAARPSVAAVETPKETQHEGI